jgi:hypothetical protein
MMTRKRHLTVASQCTLDPHSRLVRLFPRIFPFRPVHCAPSTSISSREAILPKHGTQKARTEPVRLRETHAPHPGFLRHAATIIP